MTSFQRKKLLTRQLVSWIQDCWEHIAQGPICLQRQLLHIPQGHCYLGPRLEVPHIARKDITGVVILFQ